VSLTVTVMVPVAVAAVLLPRRVVQPFVRRACVVMSVVTKAGEYALEYVPLQHGRCAVRSAPHGVCAVAFAVGPVAIGTPRLGRATLHVSDTIRSIYSLNSVNFNEGTSAVCGARSRNE
jgi:hypothetical protein